MTTNTDRIIQALRQSPGLDDDELARRANVHPRQQVNQICRRLKQQGVLKRVIGSNGKIGNILVGSQAPTSPPSPSGPPTPERFTPSRSSEFVSELDRDDRNAVETTWIDVELVGRSAFGPHRRHSCWLPLALTLRAPSLQPDHRSAALNTRP